MGKTTNYNNLPVFKMDEDCEITGINFVSKEEAIAKGISFEDKLELDLIMFGNYLLSEERRSMIQGDPNVVYHADLENWKNKQNK